MEPDNSQPVPTSPTMGYCLFCDTYGELVPLETSNGFTRQPEISMVCLSCFSNHMGRDTLVIVYTRYQPDDDSDGVT